LIQSGIRKAPLGVESGGAFLVFGFWFLLVLMRFEYPLSVSALMGSG
jgi:hypothetical protein